MTNLESGGPDEHGSEKNQQGPRSVIYPQSQDSDASQKSAASDIRYRRVTQEDAEALHGLSVSVRWSHQLNDWRLLLSIGGGFVAVLDGKVVGVTLYWHQGKTHATVGCVIVSPECQGRRIGHELMTQTLAACAGRSISLNATPQGEGLYARMGFVYRSIIAQHQAVMGECPALPVEPGFALRAMASADHANIIALHSEASGLNRAAILPTYLSVAQGIVLERHGSAVGFALFRPAGRGFAIGPVVAPDFIAAKGLISYWLSANAGQFVRLDVPESDAMCAWLESAGLPKVDRLKVMVLDAPNVVSPSSSVFALVNQALA